MINYLNDFRESPGSYYYRSNKGNSLRWHVFDQVLYRPELAKKYQNDDVQIITMINGRSLLNANGTPNSSDYSDHLPILFKVRI